MILVTVLGHGIPYTGIRMDTKMKRCGALINIC